MPEKLVHVRTGRAVRAFEAHCEILPALGRTADTTGTGRSLRAKPLDAFLRSLRQAGQRVRRVLRQRSGIPCVPVA